MSKSYIDYHRKPRVKFMSIKAYNEKHETSIAPDLAFENQFKNMWTKARAQTDPNEYLQHVFYLNNKGVESLESAGVKSVESAGVESVGAVVEGVESAQELGDFLDDFEEEVEEEYEEESIDTIVANYANDTEQFQRDISHIVHFEGDGELAGRLMKGKDRYMEKLQQYLDGDKTVKVRMLNKQEVLVSSLHPNTESLQTLLETAPGQKRFCKCDPF